jgi:hypothetical protein
METLPHQKKKDGRIETKETDGNKTQLCLTNSELILKWIFVLICVHTKHKRKKIQKGMVWDGAHGHIKEFCYSLFHSKAKISSWADAGENRIA